MPTSSIEKNFVIRGSKQAEMFVNAIEESRKAVQNMHSSNVSVEHVTDPKEVKDFKEAQFLPLGEAGRLSEKSDYRHSISWEKNGA